MSATVTNSGLLTLLLRAPAQVARQCRQDSDIRSLAAVSLAAIAVGGAAFGGVVGSFRGGTQIAFAAVKIPLAMLLALAVCVPSFHALAAVLGRPWPLRTVLALTLTSAARGSLALLAFAPAVWLAYDLGLDYHPAALLAAAAYGLAGLAAFGILLRGLGDGKGRAATVLAFGLVFFSVAAQTGWILRPYLVRPQTKDTPFLRAREGSVVDALWTASHSSFGIYSPREERQPAQVDAPVRDESSDVNSSPDRREPGSSEPDGREPDGRGVER